MNVLLDYHHGNLYHSLSLLFEKRLGFTVYRPIGIDWLTSGYFRVAEPYGNPKDTVDQFLGIDNRDWDAYSSLNGGHFIKDGIYHIYDHENGITHKAITYQKFKEMEIDLIVSTHPLHTAWNELLRYHPKAAYIAQLGNEGQQTDAVNVLCSTSDFIPKAHQNVIRYHQEFLIPPFIPPTNHTTVKSFVVGLPEPETYHRLKDALPEFDFKAHGAGSPDGTVHGPDVFSLMQESGFGYHVKPQDGYGHVIHKWFASGRPVITRKSYYKGKMAEPLLIDGKTCIDLDAHNFEESLRIIRHWAKPQNNLLMASNARDIFHAVVNFDKEAKEIKTWLESII